MPDDIGPTGGPVDLNRRWFPFRGKGFPAQVRLFCLPHAGASASAYLPWARALPRHIEVCAVELPGRAGRAAEPPLRRVRSLVRALCPVIQPLLDVPYLVHGHSMGALLAYETVRALEDMAAPPPAALVVSGMVAPARWPVRPPAYRLGTADLVAQAVNLFGLAPDIAADEDVLALLLPLLRADLEVAETYRHRPGPPLTCPVAVLAGAHDRAARLADVRAWQEVTSADFALRVFDGGHFFLHECPDVPDHVAGLCGRFTAPAIPTLE